MLVVAVEQAVAAPFASRQLADLGARVIKIERPGVGDFARGYDRTVKGQAIEFKFAAEIQGQTLNAVYTGTVDSKDSMKGKVSLVGLGDGTFTAKRQ